MISSDDNDELWSLLGKAKPPAVSPFFARNVIRELRGVRRESEGLLGMLLSHWQWTATAAIAVCVVAFAAAQFVGNRLHNRQIDSLMAITEKVSDSPDFYVINDLDDLLASEESSVWLDNTTH